MQLIGRPDIRKELQIPRINITGLSSISGAQYPSGWWQTNYSYKDIFSWVAQHSYAENGWLTANHARSRSKYEQLYPDLQFQQPCRFRKRLSVHGAETCKSGLGQPATVFSQLRQREWALFIQDDWKFRRDLL